MYDISEEKIVVYAKAVEQTLDKLFRSSERDSDKCFDKLYDLLTWPRLLGLAAIKVLGNSGAYTAGVDSVEKGQFMATFDSQIKHIRKDLLAHDGYKPGAVLRKFIPKKNGKLRPLGIPNLRDRVVQEAIRMILEPILEPCFQRDSHGFRIGHSTQDCRKDIMPYLDPQKKMQYVLEGDIKSFFDDVDHKLVWNLLGKKIHDRKFRTLIYRFLKAEVVDHGKATKPAKGTPQGGVISPLLANMVLNELDKYIGTLKSKYANTRMHTKCGLVKVRKPDGGSIGYTRYADDWVLLWNGSKEKLKEIKEDITRSSSF